MNKLWMGIVVSAVFLFSLAGQAMAIGYGGYLELGGGDGEFEFEHSSKFDIDASAVAVGFILDTDLSDRGVFNYRLNVGYDQMRLEDVTGDTPELGGLVVANTFGFAFIRKPNFRWWAGPQVRVGYYTGALESDPRVDFELLSFGIGGVTGLNFKAGNLWISPSLGVVTTGFAGETSEPGLDREFSGNETTAFLNLAFLFGQ